LEEKILNTRQQWEANNLTLGETLETRGGKANVLTCTGRIPKPNKADETKEFDN